VGEGPHASASDGVAIGPSVIVVARRSLGRALAASRPLRGGHGAPPPRAAPDVALLGRLLRLEQTRIPIGPQPGPEHLLRLRAQIDFAAFVVVLGFVAPGL